MVEGCRVSGYPKISAPTKAECYEAVLRLNHGLGFRV